MNTFLQNCNFQFHRSESKSHVSSSTKLLHAYKLIGIVEMLNNCCSRSQLLPTFALIFPIIQMTSVYVCIKLHDTLSLPALCYFALIYFDCFILITAIFTAPSQVFISSKKLLLKWKSDWRTSRKSGLRRQMRALNPIKVRQQYPISDSRYVHKNHGFNLTYLGIN
jgi:hypothetical protein